MIINQAGIDKLKTAMETEADFFRDYSCEPSLEELAEVLMQESEDEAHQSLCRDFAMYSRAGLKLTEAAWLASLECEVQ